MLIDQEPEEDYINYIIVIEPDDEDDKDPTETTSL